jgi:hypothetical protein
MSKEQNSRPIVILVTMLSLIAAGCSHKTTPAAQIDDGFSAFSATRNQAVNLVGSAKRSLDAADVNTLAVAYTALQEKANDYASFMVEAVTTSSFDPSRNAKYAGDFANAIGSFDKSFAALVTTHRTTIGAQWVPAFAQGLQSHWSRYGSVIAKMSAQQKTDLVAELKRVTVWPNYEDIATEPVVGTR